MGPMLSGGQKQRILLARALYHDPQILFIDEGTAHLDLQNEEKVLQTLTSLGITIIVVAHRSKSIEKADRVIPIVAGFALASLAKT
jgi:ATP-binding cassette subfamily B protein RaxB